MGTMADQLAIYTTQAEMSSFFIDQMGIINAMSYGVIGDGLTDDTSKLQLAFTAAAGNFIWLPANKTFKITDTITVYENTTIFAYNAKIINNTSHKTILDLESGVKIYGLELEGNGNSSADANGIGINITGLNSSNYLEEIHIEDCYIHNFGFYGMYMKFVENVIITKCKIQNLGYAGVMGLSVTNVIIDKCHIKGLTPGSNGNAYGISFNRIGGTRDTASLTANPRSKDCVVSNCLIEDNTIWEGLDTHAGENIKFTNNTIRNCKFGIAIVASHLSGTDDYAPLNCQVLGNTIYGLGTGYGISFTGAYNVNGNPTEYSYGGVINNNTLIGCGIEGDNTAGGIYIHDTEGLVISSNSLKNCYAIGINLYHTNKGFSTIGNLIVDVQDNSFTATCGISLRSTYNYGTISDNSLLRIDSSLNTYVMERGIYRAGASDIEVAIGNNYITAVAPLSGLNISSGSLLAHYLLYGAQSRLYVGSSSPESVVTATVGSIFINLSGGSSTTLYIKESGSGNTGWVGK